MNENVDAGVGVLIGILNTFVIAARAGSAALVPLAYESSAASAGSAKLSSIAAASAAHDINLAILRCFLVILNTPFCIDGLFTFAAVYLRLLM